MKLNQWTEWKPLFEQYTGRLGQTLIKRVDFTDRWAGFDKRDYWSGYHMGGCYMYAYDPDGKIRNRDPIIEDASYIGVAGSSTHRGICSRTLDFTGTVMRGLAQKNPYENGMYFRALYGKEQAHNLLVAYFPMGYGTDVKLPAHGKEKQLLDAFMDKFGRLPEFDGRLSLDILAREYARSMSAEELKSHIEFCNELAA